MAINSLYPGFIRLKYTGNAHPHEQIIPVTPTPPTGGVYGLVKKDASVYANWEDGVDAYVALMKVFLDDADGISTAELWTMASETADPIWRADMNISLPGTSASAAVPLSQAVMTFRTIGGGLYRNYIMEGTLAKDVKYYSPLPAGNYLTFASWCYSDDSFIIGRDTAPLSSVVSLISKENDALRKKYFLNV